MSGSDVIKAIKERLGIVELVSRYVDLKPNGSRFVAPCPFHQETKPSFYVMPDKGIFHCFGCQASGDIFEFYSRMTGLGFRECLEQLADECGVSIKDSSPEDHNNRKKDASEKRLLLSMHKFAAEHFTNNLHGETGTQAREYLAIRGVSPEICARFGLGWAPDQWDNLTLALRKTGYDLKLACAGGLLSSSRPGSYFDRFRGRAIFPIRDLSGHIIAFGGRIIGMEDQAKYINSQETPIYKKKENLFGLNLARRAISAKGFVFLTEGYMDVLTLHQFGFENSVGVLGTALTDEQVQRLAGFANRVYLLFDGDGPGRKAAFRSCEMLLARGLSCQVIILPPTEDIDSLLRQGGPAAFEDLQNNAVEGLAYCVDTLKNLSPREMVDWSRNFLSDIRIPELKSPFASRLSQELNISEQDLRQQATSKSDKIYSAQKESKHFLPKMREAQILAFAARYPHRIPDLKDLGVDAVLNSLEARAFLSIVAAFPEDEIFAHLDADQKCFWLAQRGPEAPPMMGNGDLELALLKEELTAYFTDTQLKSLSAAITGRSGDADFQADLEYLRALQATLGERS